MAKKNMPEKVSVYIAFNGRLWLAEGTITSREEFQPDYERVIPKGWFLTKRKLHNLHAFKTYRKTLKGGLSWFRKLYGREFKSDVRHF
jgi:hypothetical protein